MSSELQKTVETETKADEAIAKMRAHLSEISKLMQHVQINTDCIDDEVERCANIIDSAFTEISIVLDKRKQTLLHELKKTAKNKKLALLLQHNELNNKYQQSQDRINKMDESRQNQQHDEIKNHDILNTLHMDMAKKDLLSTDFDLHFNNNHSKQLVQLINHFGSISANPVPNLLSLTNNGRNCVVNVTWNLPSSSIGILDTTKTQKLRIEWSDAKEVKWNRKEFVFSDDKKQNQSEIDHTNFINVANNGTYMFRIRHYYLSKWSKYSNTTSISISGVSYDCWDTIYHGNNVRVEGKCVAKKNETGYESAFLCEIASEGVHQWRFKLEGGHKTGPQRIFGIWRVDPDDNNDTNDEKKQNDSGDKVENVDINKVLDTYFTNEEFVDPNSHQAYGKAFGDKCHEGDIVDMFLDLVQLKLFYKLNDTIYGKPVDIARANYKAVVTFYCVDDRIRLLNYRQ